MGVRVADGGEVLAVYSTLIDQIVYDGRGLRRGELPVGLKAVLQLGLQLKLLLERIQILGSLDGYSRLVRLVNGRRMVSSCEWGRTES